jgi:hypothetical protein
LVVLAAKEVAPVTETEGKTNGTLGSDSPRATRADLVQLHLWTRREDLAYLKQVAAERDQTVSAVVRSIVRAYRRSRAA